MLEAVSHWNTLSQKLQDIVDQLAAIADIEALTLDLEQSTSVQDNSLENTGEDDASLLTCKLFI